MVLLTSLRLWLSGARHTDWSDRLDGTRLRWFPSKHAAILVLCILPSIHPMISRNVQLGSSVYLREFRVSLMVVTVMTVFMLPGLYSMSYAFMVLV